MMASGKLIKLKAEDGRDVEFSPDIIASGAMKDVYMHPDRKYVVAFFRKKPDARALDRLVNITGLYHQAIFQQTGGEYWQKLFCWPERIVKWEGKTGIVAPAYDQDFYFAGGKFKGREKEGKWFASAKLRNRFLEPGQLGDWRGHLRICLNLARAARRLHAAGLAHSDLSYKNVLVDPISGRACIIDIDGLVVPGKYPPDVVGTPDFIAPEVMETRHLHLDAPGKNLPGIPTDRHALAVLIYMYLFYRHPLRGPLVHDLDPSRDEELAMGKNALFIEHPKDKRNRPNRDSLDLAELPQGDLEKLPFTIGGPHLEELFLRAFVDGLRNPGLRPSAADWESALLKTLDLLIPCANPACSAKWHVFNNSRKPACPFCGERYTDPLPVLNLYWAIKKGTFKPERQRLMVYANQSLHLWHVSRMYSANEKLKPENKKPVGEFIFANGHWQLKNLALPSLYDKSVDRKIEIGSAVALEDGKKILLSTETGGRLIVAQLVNA